MAEAVSEINSGTGNSEKLSNVIYLDEAELDIVDENVYEFDEDGSCEKLMGLVRQNLSQDEFKLLCCAYGIDCKQCSDPKKTGKTVWTNGAGRQKVDRKWKKKAKGIIWQRIKQYR